MFARVVARIILAGATASVAAQAPTTTSHYLRHPSGQGDLLVFQFHDHIWRYDASGTTAVPLAVTDADHATPRMSPDAQSVAYVARSGGGDEVHLVTVATGASRRLTYDGSTSVQVQGWLSNHEVLYSTTIRSKKRGALLFVLDTQSLAIRPVPLAEASEGCLLGDKFVFVKNEKLLDSNRGYKGGYAQRIYAIDRAVLGKAPPADLRAELLSRDYEGVSRAPVCSNGRIYFLSDRSGRYAIWSMDAVGGTLNQHTRDAAFDIGAFAATGPQTLVYESLGKLSILDLERQTIRALEVPVPTETIDKKVRLNVDVGAFTQYDVSRDASMLAAVARGRVWIVDAGTRTARCVQCDSAVRSTSAQFTADGRGLIVVADRGGEYGIYWLSLHGRAGLQPVDHGVTEPIHDVSVSPNDEHLLVRTLEGSLYHVSAQSGATRKIELSSRTRPEEISWSPDGRLAAFVNYTAQDLGQVVIFDARCATTRLLTSGRSDVSSPVFSGDSRQIFYLNHSNFRSSIIDTWAPGNYWPSYDERTLVNAVAFDASASCVPPASDNAMPLPRELPMVAGNYVGLVSQGGQLLAFSKRAIRDPWGQLVFVSDLRQGSRAIAEPLLTSPVYDYRASGDGQILAARHESGLALVQSDASGKPHLVLLDSLAGLEAEVDLSAEYGQMFHDVWRLYRDHFWDRSMAGVDWSAAREKYVTALPRVSTRAEFNDLVSHLVAELGAGHTMVGNPEAAGQENVTLLGRLGASVVDVQGLHLTEVYDGDVDLPEERSPMTAARPRINVGDRIIRLNGFPVANSATLDHLLEGKAGQTIVLTVRKPDGTKVDARVHPVSPSHEAWLRAQHWAEQNRRLVDEKTGARVGYIRLSSAYEADFSAMIRQHTFLHDREAMILDLRGNNGGNVDPWVLSLLQRRTWLYVGDRHDAFALTHPRDSFQGQLIVLIDGDTYSDGELIAEGVRRLGLGTLIGTRTSGAGVWVNDDNTLVDGGRVRIPVSGSFEATTEAPRLVIEGRGVVPDVVVDNDPYQFYLGHDAQLDAAIETALRAIPSTKTRAASPALKGQKQL